MIASIVVPDTSKPHSSQGAHKKEGSDIRPDQHHYEIPEPKISTKNHRNPAHLDHAEFYNVPNHETFNSNISAFSNENIEYFNDGLLARPQAVNANKFAKLNLRNNSREGLNSQNQVRKNSKDPRISSGDPRLKGLESIYLAKFGGSVSQKHLGFKGNKIIPP